MTARLGADISACTAADYVVRYAILRALSLRAVERTTSIVALQLIRRPLCSTRFAVLETLRQLCWICTVDVTPGFAVKTHVFLTIQVKVHIRLVSDYNFECTCKLFL